MQWASSFDINKLQVSGSLLATGNDLGLSRRSRPSIDSIWPEIAKAAPANLHHQMGHDRLWDALEAPAGWGGRILSRFRHNYLK